MCGICGVFDPRGADRDRLVGMVRTLAHRGPDDEGVHIDGPAGLGSRRLSIIDVPGGHQPLSNEDGTVWVVHNGEIYNHEALRHDLEHRGHRFRTQSDTEVLVHLYEEYGERCVEKLAGMFAFAIWDAPRRRLFVARDRLGQKPLFYSQRGETLWFGSELKSLLAAGADREVDVESLHDYLSLRFIPSPRTMFRSVSKLPPAHYLVFENGKLETRRYWQLSFHDKLEMRDDEFVDHLRMALERAVESHLVSDVPVGALLSGGMDSSMIVALMSRSGAPRFGTFAIGVAQSDFDERPYARAVAERYTTAHVEREVEPDFLEMLPWMVYHLDEPSDPIAACMYHAAELASERVKVVLGGDGGDELFGGFDRYLGVRRLERFNAIPGFLWRGLVDPILDRVPEDFGYKSTTQKMRWVRRLGALPSMAERYAEATCFFRFGHEDKRSLYTERLWNRLGEIRSTDVIVDAFRSEHAEDPLDRMLYADFTTRLPEHSLMLTDRMSMAHGLESRSPFLDHELVEYLARFPARMKIRGSTLKFVLRRLAADYLPDRLVHRPKQGFMLPVARWLREEMGRTVYGVLRDSNAIREGWFRREEVERLWEEHQGGRVDHHVRLWMLLNLEVWHRMYVDGEDPGAVGESLSGVAHAAPLPAGRS